MVSKSCILAIESSCDDTSVAIMQNGKIISNITATQEVHKTYGGVVPELASRQHDINLIPTLTQALQKANMTLEDISAIAVTEGPGLLGSLLVGVNFAKALSLSLGIPLVPAHHMHGHVFAHFIDDPKPTFPFLCLTVSGGHTQIVSVQNDYSMQILGQTLDDAAGEAFDKTGKMLGLDYPSGPILDKLAKKGIARFEFPEPTVDNLDFSFSGLKTSILYFLQKKINEDSDFVSKNLNDICASVQSRIVSILINKLEKAVRQTGVKSVGIAGGVAANSGLRKAFEQSAKKMGYEAFIPAFSYCTDNAAMIAKAGEIKYKNGRFGNLNLKPDPKLAF